MSLSVPLSPQSGSILRVVAVCRISTEKQDEKSLDDQEALLRKFISENYEGPVEWTEMKSQGSGEALDRKEFLHLGDYIESGKYDLVIAEDLSRICRRMAAVTLCESCEDSETRLIALNDRVDTANEGWQDTAYMSSWHHERSNRDGSDRIRRTLRNRHMNGEALAGFVYGYIVPEGAKHDSEVKKDPEAEHVYDHWFKMLEEGASYAYVADWLNTSGIPVGPCARNKQWDCRMVGRVTQNEILKGTRVRNKLKSKRVNKTGRRKSVAAPPGERLDRHCPHLAFIKPERWERVIQMLTERNQHYARKGDTHGRDTRKNVPKKRTRFPGQMIECGICGRKYVFGGHGQTDHLMCDGARDYACWNGASVDGPLAQQKILEAVLAELEQMPDFDAVFLGNIQNEAKKLDAVAAEQEIELDRKIRGLQRELDNLMKAFRSNASSERLHQELQEVESEHKDHVRDLELLKRRPREEIQLPSIEDLRAIAHQNLIDVDTTAWKFHQLMARMIPKIVVYPFRLIDGGDIVLRAKFRLHLGNLHSDSLAADLLIEPLERILTVNLFQDPQREAFREQVVSLRSRPGMTERKIAKQLGLTITATQRAAKLQRLMDEQNLTDAYQPVTEPPDSGRIRRHKHKRYEFQPRPNAGEI